VSTRGEREVRAFFEAAGVPVEIHRFDDSTHNSELAARNLGVEVGQIAKTILLMVDGAPVVAVISGDRRVDLKKVRALRGGRKVRLAGPEDVVAHTGFAVGAVSPVALPAGIPVYLDRSLRRFGTIYPAAGETNNMFVSAPDALLALTGATGNRPRTRLIHAEDPDQARQVGGREPRTSAARVLFPPTSRSPGG